MFRTLTRALLIAIYIAALGVPPSGAQSIDWLDPGYILKAAKNGQSDTADSQKRIMSFASGAAKSGPYTIINTKSGVVPPSQNKLDYLSWAPYHWPNCNWCGSGGSKHIAMNQSSEDDGSDDGDGMRPSDYDNEGYEERRRSLHRHHRHHRHHHHHSNKHHRIVHGKRLDTPDTSDVDDDMQPATPPTQPPLSLSTNSIVPFSTPTISQASAGDVFATSDGQDSASRKKKKTSKSASKTGGSKCTPSPTKSMAPSATWTTCPYQVKDGRYNPDVRELQGTKGLNNAAKTAQYNAISYALTGKDLYSKNAIDAIDALMLSSSTGMDPHMKYAQLIRGPGKAGQYGTPDGFLDGRMFVEIINAITILEAAKSPDWTSSVEGNTKNWASKYVSWAENEQNVATAMKRPNNHATFATVQFAAWYYVLGNQQKAVDTLNHFFNTTFLDQIASTGEQPFEAIRTRPYHYRTFNLNALITAAKIGDQLGMDIWSFKSKYGKTIQDALDFTIFQAKPGREEISDVFPHVVAVAAAYGDKDGKYASWLKQYAGDYQSQPFYFFDQSAAISRPHGDPSKTKSTKSRRSENPSAGPIPRFWPKHWHRTGWRSEPDPEEVEVPSVAERAMTNFQCPQVFNLVDKVEISDGIFVTCDEIKPFYMDNYVPSTPGLPSI